MVYPFQKVMHVCANVTAHLLLPVWIYRVQQTNKKAKLWKTCVPTHHLVRYRLYTAFHELKGPFPPPLMEAERRRVTRSRSILSISLRSVSSFLRQVIFGTFPPSLPSSILSLAVPFSSQS